MYTVKYIECLSAGSLLGSAQHRCLTLHASLLDGVVAGIRRLVLQARLTRSDDLVPCVMADWGYYQYMGMTFGLINTVY